ncbi:MAG: tetratricopeptide repeat protein, partial [Candidatus Wallbacteria bacterium]|nr:tetratricopeptide repeat protein [Candidatus Wallbacteria bacterium]
LLLLFNTVHLLSSHYLISGQSAQESGNLDQAIALYHQSLKLRPYHVPAMVQLSDAYARKKMLPEALACLERASVFEPWRPSVNFNTGSVLARLGKVDQAIARFETFLSLSRTGMQSIDARVSLSILHLTRNEPDRALSYLRSALESDPDNTLANYQAGRAYEMLGNMEKARIYYSRSGKR